MPRLPLSIALFTFATLTALGQTPEIQSIVTMKRDLYFLASDECEGRGPGTKGIDKAADYIAKQFKEAGLKPGGVDGGYFQPFTISGPPVLGKPNAVAFKGPEDKSNKLEEGKDFEVMGLSGSGKVDGGLVFAGYGIQSKSQKYDDYAGLDVAGKVVIVLRRTPRYNAKEPFAGKERDTLASLDRKVATAESNKAKAVIVVNDVSEKDDKIPPFGYLAPSTSSKIPCVHVSRAAIEPILKAGLGESLADVEKKIDEDLTPRSKVLANWTAAVETTVSRPGLPVKNVIGVLDGNGPLAKEIIVVGAHYDHLGYGGMGSLAKDPKEKAIHYGADDNGSGTTAMMELARRFAAIKDRQGRKLVFMAFSAEERGLLGSQYFCNKQPLVPLEDIAAMVNVDMVGHLRQDANGGKNKVIVQGTGTSKGFDKFVESLNKESYGFTLAKVPAGMGPSDHQSFYQKKIPVLFFWTGVHQYYHRPTDTADRINYEGMLKIVDYVDTVVAQLATDKERPKYEEVKGTTTTGAPKGPRLGIAPAYEADKEGVTISSVTDGGAAQKAGLKSGDRIVEIAGKNVTNIETYMVIMGEQKVGQQIDIGIIREGKKISVKATPQ